MNTRKHISALLASVTMAFSCGVGAQSVPSVEDAQSALSRDKHSPRQISTVGDARFMQNDNAAYADYTRAWSEDFTRAWKDTKGDSPVWKVLAAGVAILGVAADVTSAQQGLATSYAPEAIATSGQMMSTIEEATGDPKARQTVKAVMGDLKSLSKRGPSSYRIIRPVHNRVAGAAMARVHTPNGVCNAVRVDAGRYAVSSSCLGKMGAPTGVTIGTTLRPEDFSSISEVTPDGDESIVAVPANGETDIAASPWKPQRMTDGSVGGKPDAWGATWFAPEFKFLVPVFEPCSSDRFDDCGDVHANNALLWARQDGAWKFYGFATPDGKIASRYVAASP